MKKGLLILISLTVLAGCFRTRNDIEAEEQVSRATENISQLQQKTADQEVRFQDIDTELRALSGRIQTLEQNLADQARGDSEKAQGLEERVAKLEEIATLFQDELGKIQKSFDEIKNEMDQLKKSRANSDSSSTSSKKKKKLGNYGGAEVAFDEKRWEDAILGYQKYLELNPKGRVAHLATYKIGVSFQELGQIDEAKTFFQLTIDTYPKSDGARRAAYRLKNLK